ncbi:helix-turn-helix domain-containing protein [Pseudonocardia nigra]|uniref:helix-turn-helix domain-containing protein n=1 Tax=Pseudonocardia nigra TaxID=1921578 RepID=UPI001C5E687F|nr:helix-turn-helix transcriptional regulator [Pseudonocardia nigra]
MDERRAPPGDNRTIGRQLRVIRRSRGKSQQVIADLAGISKSHLSRLESGQRALDRRSLIVALAAALEVAPTELTEIAMPAVSEPGIGPAVDRVRLALLSVGMGAPSGEPVPPNVLRTRVAELLDDQQACRHDTVGAALPGLICDLHATLATGRDGPGIAELAVLLHVQGTQAWLRDVGGPLDLGWQTATIAQQEAQRVDDPQLLGLAAFGTGHGLLAAGAFDLAAHQLDTARTATSTADVRGMQLAGMLTFTSSLLAAARREPPEAAAALDEAAELAARTGEANAWWFGFGPTNVGVWRMAVALEAGDHAQAATVAETLDPALIPSPQRQAAYWADYGRALAHLRGRAADASHALRRAELISPARVQRHPFVRETLAELVSKAHRDAVGRELRGMAFRAGLPV